MLQFPSSEEQWRKIADGFNTRWQFPNCIGAIDGKHIFMQAVPGAGSEYINYKGTQSIVLMAMVDANYRFVYVDIGCNGHVSDGGVLRDSTLGRAMFGDDTTNFTMNVPLPVPLPGCVHPVPFFAVGDDALPLRNNLMKPYPLRTLSSDQRIFNYRLSRARRVVENVFGIFANRFRVFRSPINLSPQKVETIVLAATVLHKYLATISDAAGVYDNPDSDDNCEMLPLQRNTGSNHSTLAARDVRDEIADYCITHGHVSWQWEKVFG